MIPLVLASSSPRRKELLSLLGMPFDIMQPDIEEKRRVGEAPRSYAQRNAREKSEAVYRKLKTDGKIPTLVISADTIVVLGDRVLEKPASTLEAENMLKDLAAKTHVVITSFAIFDGVQMIERSVETDVTFKALSAQEIKRYVATGEPMDKAGAYGAQGLSAYFIKSVRGSYTNVVGLPIAEVCEELEALQFKS